MSQIVIEGVQAHLPATARPAGARARQRVARRCARANSWRCSGPRAAASRPCSISSAASCRSRPGASGSTASRSPGRDPTAASCSSISRCFPWKTVRANILYGLERQGMPRAEREQRAQAFIELVGLKGFEDSYPSQLSGGMKQRTAIARTLAFDPAILLMDEPFGALDAQTRSLMQDELLGIWQRTPKTVIFVTHDVREAVLSRRPRRRDVGAARAHQGDRRDQLRQGRPRVCSSPKPSSTRSMKSGTSCATRRSRRRRRRAP